MVRAELHGGVDSLHRADAFIEGIDRLIDHRNQNPIDDKGGEIFGIGGGLAQGTGEGHGGLIGANVGGDAANDLDQLHQRHGIHEMQADKALRPVGRRGQTSDRNG